MHRFLPLALLFCPLIACDDGEEKVELQRFFEYNEADDYANEISRNAEEASSWNEEQALAHPDLRLEIHGASSACDWNNDPEAHWPWIGDQDFYLVTVPADGYLELLLDWDSQSDLDMLVALNPGSAYQPDAQAASVGSEGPEDVLFDQVLTKNDDLVIDTTCTTGTPTDYTLTVIWEE